MADYELIETTDILERIDDLIDYVESGIIINEISTTTSQLEKNPATAALIPFIDSVLFIDIPSRDVTIATATINDTNYLVIYEELHPEEKVLILKIDDVTHSQIKSLVSDTLMWYDANKEEIAAKKLETLRNILAQVSALSR